MAGTKDITTDTQKVAQVRSDHRLMMVDPTTKALVYAEINQLGEGDSAIGGAGAPETDDDIFDL